MMNNENILLVDAGNTSTCIASHNGNSLSSISRIDTRLCSTASVRYIIAKTFKRKLMAGGILCSVVPKVNQFWIREINRITGKDPIVVNYKLDFGVKLDYPEPQTLGPDRLANVCAVVEKYGFPVMVADFGTAATFDVVNAKCTFIGGIIAPGLRVMTDYMADRTALLPRININGSLPRIGRTTVEAMKIGAIAGYRGLVYGITQYIIKKNKLGRIKLVATGGLAETVLRGNNLRYQVDKSLTMRGLYRIYKLNNKK